MSNAIFQKKKCPIKQLLRKKHFNTLWTKSLSVPPLKPFSGCRWKSQQIKQYNNKNLLDSLDDDHKNLMISTMRTIAASDHLEF